MRSLPFHALLAIWLIVVLGPLAQQARGDEPAASYAATFSRLISDTPAAKTGTASRAFATASDVPADGSVLRLVAGATGRAPDPDNPVPIPMPPSAADKIDTTPPGVAKEPLGAQPDEDLHWANPYHATLEPDDKLQRGEGWRRWLPPPGICPYWGPRTSEAERYTGWGEPLYGASWLNRPLGAGWFAGFIQGGAPIPHSVGQHGGFFGGYRFTWDYDYYYGLEARIGASAISLAYDEYNRPHATSDYYVGDISILYYPWGDSRWRPFTTLGFGTTKLSFYDFHDQYFAESLASMPFGFGLKFRLREWLVFRGEIIDNLAFGRGSFTTMNSVSYTGGVEIRFGGLRKLYFPWHPSTQMW